MIWGRRAITEIEGLKIEGLTTRFNVQLEAGNFGKAEIAIFNLNSEHRKEIEKRADAEVSLSVGYEDIDPFLIFKGDMREASSAKDPPDWVTVLRTSGGKAVAQVRHNKSYAAGTTKETMWKDLVGALSDAGIAAGNALEKFAAGSFKDGINSFLQGGTGQGAALPQLKTLARARGLDVHIQDKELVITKIGEPLETPAVVLSPTTGLIGSPKKGTEGILQVRALLLPGLRPKRKVRIKSTLVDSLYVITKAQYKGDTSATDWYADLECREAK